MQRRSFVKQAGLAGVLATTAAPAVQAQEPLRWRLASSFPRTLDTLFGTAEMLAAQVSRMTGGRFQIAVHPAGELLPPFGMLEGVHSGTVEIAHTAPYYYVARDETFALDAAIPFGLNARLMNAWLYAGNGLKLLREFYAGFNIVNFPGGNTGAQMGGWYRKEIKTLEDLKGLRFRVNSFGGRVLSRLGVVPQGIPAGEIYQALEKGSLDAAEWIGPYDDQKLGLNRVAKFYYYPAWWEGGTNFSFYVNAKAHEALPSELRAILEAATTQAAAHCSARYDAYNPLALKELLASGVELHAFPREILDAAFKAATELYDELNQKNANWRRIYGDYLNFRRDGNNWLRYAEASFDQFLQRQRY